MSRAANYKLYQGVTKAKARINVALATVLSVMTLGGAALVASPVFAAPAVNNGKVFSSSSTTLDACGYFTGEQTTRSTTSRTEAGVTYTTERGTWTGVSNNYGGGPVSSLGSVQGSFTQTTSTDGNGNVTGVETFTSDAGKIDQTFTYGPDVAGGYSVVVTATRDLSFLTSSTDGHCYTGAFPRP